MVMQILTKSQSKLVDHAIRVALDGDMGKLHGCVIADNTKPVSWSNNETRSYLRGNVVGSLHAEVNALVEFLRLRKKKVATGLDAWVVRVSKETGELTTSRPCRNCMAVLKSHGIRRVWYSCEDGSMECEHLRDVNVMKSHVTELCRDNNIRMNRVRLN